MRPSLCQSLGCSKQGCIDVARLGAVIARGFDCRWRTIDASITPENRILLGLARPKGAGRQRRAEIAKQSDARLSHIYARIHGCSSDPCAADPPRRSRDRDPHPRRTQTTTGADFAR